MFRLAIFRLNRALLTVVLLGAASHATADIITRPVDLNEGDQYRLGFVTSSGTNAVPDGVAYYNGFVTNAANSVPELTALSTDWRAIVSSTTFGANENTGTSDNFGVPIYRLDGLRIANDELDLWDRTIINPINRTELDTIRSSNVWTGTRPDGAPAFVSSGGSTFDASINSGFPVAGNSSSADRNWINITRPVATDVLPLYGMSGILTATALDTPVAAIPEPSTYALMLVGLGIVGFVAKRRRKGQAVAH